MVWKPARANKSIDCKTIRRNVKIEALSSGEIILANICKSICIVATEKKSIPDKNVRRIKIGKLHGYLLIWVTLLYIKLQTKCSEWLTKRLCIFHLAISRQTLLYAAFLIDWKYQVQYVTVQYLHTYIFHRFSKIKFPGEFHANPSCRFHALFKRNYSPLCALSVFSRCV